MRLVVIGEVYPQADTTLKGRAWFRYPVPKERQALYAELQSKLQPEAPGNYDAEHAAEKTSLQNGEFVEREVGSDARFDPGSGLEVMQEMIARDYELAAASFAKSEAGRWQFYGSTFDGTTWSMESA